MKRILRVLSMSLVLAILVTSLFAGAVFANDGEESGDYCYRLRDGNCECTCADNSNGYGAPATQGVCPTCVTKMFRIGK